MISSEAQRCATFQLVAATTSPKNSRSLVRSTTAASHPKPIQFVGLLTHRFSSLHDGFRQRGYHYKSRHNLNLKLPEHQTAYLGDQRTMTLIAGAFGEWLVDSSGGRYNVLNSPVRTIVHSIARSPSSPGQHFFGLRDYTLDFYWTTRTVGPYSPD